MTTYLGREAVVVLLSVLLTGSASSAPEETPTNKEPSVGTAFYDHRVKNVSGEDVSLSRYRGEVCLVVNVASK